MNRLNNRRARPAFGENSKEGSEVSSLKCQMEILDASYMLLFEQVFTHLDEASKKRISSDPEIQRLQNSIVALRSKGTGMFGGFMDFSRGFYNIMHACAC